MSQISCQQRQAGLHVRSLAVPGGQSVYGEGMTQIVEPWLPASVGWASDLSVLTESNKHVLQPTERDHAACA